MIPTMTSGKGEAMETVKRSVVAGDGGGGREMNRQSTEDFQSGETTLYATVLLDTRHTFVQTHRMFHPKHEPYCKLWTLGDNDVSVQVQQL